MMQKGESVWIWTDRGTYIAVGSEKLAFVDHSMSNFESEQMLGAALIISQSRGSRVTYLL